ncbi:MAG: hypothetical protein ACPLSK_00065 [bacterium]
MELIRERLKAVMDVQREVARERNRLWIGRTMEILVEGRNEKIFYGRSFREAPEVDGQVFFKGKNRYIGEFILGKIVNADSYHLYAEEVER